jgi:tRNA A37 N6-isopentenylltransferase MiaA
METNLCEKALLEMLQQAEPELRQKYGDDSAVQILDEVLYPIAEKLIEKDASEHATANMATVEATQTKTDKERLEQIVATPIEEMVNDDVLRVIANVLDMCIDELDESTTDEERVRTLDRALKCMVAVGRWSILQ